ncbi:hypothetical protein EBT16_15170, partial [bacterium]|nr:hypothetical protein [bacterium]
MPKGCERYTMEFCVEDENGEEVVYDVEFLISGADPGKLYGPPEDCWPPDPGDVEFFRVTEQKTGR